MYFNILGKCPGRGYIMCFSGLEAKINPYLCLLLQQWTMFHSPLFYMATDSIPFQFLSTPISWHSKLCWNLLKIANVQVNKNGIHASSPNSPELLSTLDKKLRWLQNECINSEHKKELSFTSYVIGIGKTIPPKTRSSWNQIDCEAYLKVG